MIKGYLFSAGYALICLLLAFVLYKLGVAKKITRKVVHILIGFEWVILAKTMGASLHFLVVCLLFTLLLLFTHRKSLLPMISSDGDNSPGTVYYGVAMTIMAIVMLFVPDMIIPFGIGVFCTSFGDGFAGLIGQAVVSERNKKIYQSKTIVGTLVNFLVSFAIVAFFNIRFSLGLSILFIVAISAFATELEVLSGRGLDNIAITLGASFLSYGLIYYDKTVDYLVPILLTPIIIAFAKGKKALTVSGIIAAVVVDIIISVFLGNFGFLILLSFFIGGILVDKIKKKLKKNQSREIEKRGDCRDHVQVLVNSIVATVCAMLYGILGYRVFLVAFVAALAEAFADTAASGIGVISGKAFDIFHMRACPVGLSGGMSIVGTISSLLGGLLISIFAFSLGKISFVEGLIVAVSAFIGAIFDSFLGSVAQVKYKCQKCSIITEKEEHCGEKTLHTGGISFINNDLVNLLSTIFSAVLSVIICIIFL